MKDLDAFSVGPKTTKVIQKPMWNQKKQKPESAAEAENRRRQEAERRWEEAGISDDYIFYKVMGNNYDLCLKLVQMILPGLGIQSIRYINAQETAKANYDSKGIRMDVFVRDNHERAIDIEMQVVAAKNLPKRSRYYQGVVDMTMLKPGDSYSALKDSYVIFICLEDPFNLNGKMYTFSDACHEYPELCLGSGATKIFLNVSGENGIVSGELDKFLGYVDGRDYDTAFIEKVKKAVNYAKQNSEWRREYMIATMRDLEQREWGKEEGREEERDKIIYSMYLKGCTFELIADVTESSIEEIDAVILSKQHMEKEFNE